MALCLKKTKHQNCDLERKAVFSYHRWLPCLPTRTPELSSLLICFALFKNQLSEHIEIMRSQDLEDS